MSVQVLTMLVKDSLSSVFGRVEREGNRGLLPLSLSLLWYAASSGQVFNYYSSSGKMDGWMEPNN